MSLPLWNTPPTVGLSDKTSVNVAQLSSGNSKTGSKTNDYLPNSKAVGLNIDPHNVAKQQWTGIGFPDIYCYPISTLEKYTKPEGIQKSG